MGRDKVGLFACAATAVLAGTAPAFAQSTPAPAADSATPESEEIIVRADGDQVRIDRRIYAVSNDPIAQSTDMFDALSHVPSVSIDPSGAVSLLGGGQPEIQINHQPLPQGVTVEQALRGIQGSDVVRIEVITNPSSQFSSATSNGIIDIITRTRFDRGLSGMATASGDSFGGGNFNFSPSWSRGPLSIGTRLGYYRSSREFNAHSTLTDLTTGDVDTDTSDVDSEFHGLYGSLEANYQFDPKNKATLSFNGWGGDGSFVQDKDRVDLLGPVFHQDQDTDFIYDGNAVGLQAQHDGDKAGEQLRFNANLAHGQNSNDSDTDVQLAAGPSPSPFLSRNAGNWENASSTLDYDLPLGERNTLSVGLSAESFDQHINNLQRTVGGSPTDFVSGLTGREDTLAAYGTYQFGIGTWIAQPGVRVEDYRREVTSGGSDTDTHDLRAFPSLHLRRTFSKIDLDLSYTSRINRPGIDSLDPAVRFTDATHAMSGNPDLRPTTVDAYEASLNYQNHDQSVSLTFYDRMSHNVISSFETQVGDVLFSTQVNAGDSEKRGLDLTLRGSFTPVWRYSLSADALSNSTDVLRNGALTRSDSFEYFGTASLEYRDTNQTVVGANDVKLDFIFRGPQQDLQTETDATYSLNLAWRRRFSDHLFGFVQVTDVFASSETTQTTRGDDFIERGTQESPGARIRVSLTYQFGSNAADRPPPPPSEGGGGGGPQQ